MTDYAAPIKEMRFALALAGLDEVRALPGFEEATPDLIDAILDEAGRFGAEALAPLNRTGDLEGCRLEDDTVIAPPGFAEAYAQFVEAGWQSLVFDPEHGGQGMPWLLQGAVGEIWQAANLSFGLAPLLTQGAIEALTAHGSEHLKATYLPNMIAGTWAGTMNLTEPQAGTDLAQVRLKAVRAGEETYRLSGQKIFITWGDHAMAENIIHLVLGRLPDAPAGVKGISLFLVPKFLLNPDGTPGPRNDVHCAGLEHKLGIHGSATCTMAFGEEEGAVGYLVGEENRGLEYMFTMMNNARLSVGMQGVAIGERAYQQALAYARERIQSKSVTAPREAGPGTIVHHPDVRRMLLSMRSRVEAARALGYYAHANIDLADHHPDPEVRARAEATVQVLTPVVKAWASEIGVSAADLGVQIHGGMGYVEETGAAQHLRDARICPIYEGTNGVQAADLVGRKLLRDQGAGFARVVGAMEADLATLGDAARPVAEALLGLKASADHLMKVGDMGQAMGAATPFLNQFGTVAGGWMMARALAAVEGNAQPGITDDPNFAAAKRATARFYLDQVLPLADAFATQVTADQSCLLALPEEALATT
ncbi:acyl-CoA dehydrogenase [Roseospirillum parvum]|uniref:3-methylmercaptopropionyl-CoA dehydrogenase n=1 Tax=Roseospirillum parvum TaxID=83401 RepID=A0A1G8ESD4_9PROT|nr:acyl-CoA dehydrogenase [Roseospirillum parvum]SDH72760.1 Acyl-CoA dehydrogenase [Roseospirillum parvum]